MEKRRAQCCLAYGRASTIHRIKYIVIRLSTKSKRMAHRDFNIIAELLGEEAPGAVPTPQKRGPLPPLTGRRGRLPNFLAAISRPTVACTTLQTYKKITDTHCQKSSL